MLLHPDDDAGFMRLALRNMTNQLAWMQDPELVAWLVKARLDGLSTMPDGNSASIDAFMAIGAQAADKLQNYLAEIDGAA